jgi:hypothetical protein
MSDTKPVRRIAIIGTRVIDASWTDWLALSEGPVPERDLLKP